MPGERVATQLLHSQPHGRPAGERRTRGERAAAGRSRPGDDCGVQRRPRRARLLSCGPLGRCNPAAPQLCVLLVSRPPTTLAAGCLPDGRRQGDRGDRVERQRGAGRNLESDPAHSRVARRQAARRKTIVLIWVFTFPAQTHFTFRFASIGRAEFSGGTVSGSGVSRSPKYSASLSALSSLRNRLLLTNRHSAACSSPVSLAIR